MSSEVQSSGTQLYGDIFGKNLRHHEGKFAAKDKKFAAKNRESRFS